MSKKINKNGLVGHWAYHGDVAALGTWYDMQGKNNGTLNGNSFIDANGVNLDGSGDYVSNGSDASFNSTSVTYSAFINGSSFPSGSNAVILAIGNSSATEYRGITILNGKPRLVIQAGPYNEWEADITLSTGIFYLFTVSQSSFDTTPKIFINGIEQTVSLVESNGTLTRLPSTQSLTTGRLGDYGGLYFNGKIDDTRLYSRVLSATEIKQIYNTTRGKYA